MKDWIRRKFDNTPPQQGTLSEYEKTMLGLGLILGFAVLPFSQPVAVFILLLCLVCAGIARFARRR
jgi:hypothetical protein